jgi:GNAT superfamily N-acetyltransferase
VSLPRVLVGINASGRASFFVSTATIVGDRAITHWRRWKAPTHLLHGATAVVVEPDHRGHWIGISVRLRQQVVREASIYTKEAADFVA